MPGRSNSAATSGASAHCTGSSRRAATTGGAPDPSGSSALFGRTALPGSNAATPGKASSLPPFVPTGGAARPVLDPEGVAIAAASWDRAGEAAVDGPAAGRPATGVGACGGLPSGWLRSGNGGAGRCAAPGTAAFAAPGWPGTPVCEGDRAVAAAGPGAGGAVGRWTVANFGGGGGGAALAGVASGFAATGGGSVEGGDGAGSCDPYLSSISAIAASSAFSSREMSLSGSGGRKLLSWSSSALRARS